MGVGYGTAELLAVGVGRHSSGDFSHSLSIANGSLCEVETQLGIAKKLGFINDEIYNFFDWQDIRVRGKIALFLEICSFQRMTIELTS